MMLRAFVRRAADVPAADTGRLNMDLYPFARRERAEHAFGGRRTADVPGANEEDVHGPKIADSAMRLKIRPATLRDAPALVAFNSAMALETEGKVLLPRIIGAGVRGLLRR